MWLAVAQAQPQYTSKMEAEMQLHTTIWGNDEEFVTHSRGRVPPSPVDTATGESGPVVVTVSVMIEKAKIDTVLQVATIKWWLRQTWKVPFTLLSTARVLSAQCFGVVPVLTRYRVSESRAVWSDVACTQLIDE